MVCLGHSLRKNETSREQTQCPHFRIYRDMFHGLAKSYSESLRVFSFEVRDESIAAGQESTVRVGSIQSDWLMDWTGCANSPSFTNVCSTERNENAKASNDSSKSFLFEAKLP